MPRPILIIFNIAFIVIAFTASLLLPDYRPIWSPKSAQPLQFYLLVIERFAFIYVVSGILPFLIWKYGHLIRVRAYFYSFLVWALTIAGTIYFLAVHDLKDAEINMAKSIVNGQPTGAVRDTLLREATTICVQGEKDKKEPDSNERIAAYCHCFSEEFITALFVSEPEEEHKKRLAGVAGNCRAQMPKP